LGTLEDAIRAARSMAGLKKDGDVEPLILPKPRNITDILMESRSDTRLRFQASGQISAMAGRNSALIPEITRDFRS
jgi:hypothetical protein